MRAIYNQKAAIQDAGAVCRIALRAVVAAAQHAGAQIRLGNVCQTQTALMPMTRGEMLTWDERLRPQSAKLPATAMSHN